MNIKTLRHTTAKIALALMLACPWVASCSSDSPAAPYAGTRSLCFAVDNISIGSRVSHDGYKSAFEEGDKIGCVIIDTKKAGDDRYMANTCWEYNNDGFLILRKVFDANNALQNLTDNTIITPDAVKAAEGEEWIKLANDEAAYKMLFYYPYTGFDEIKEELQSATDASEISYPNVITDNLGDKNLDFISKNYLALPVGKTNSPSWVEPLSLAWTCYPTFVNINQSVKAGFNRSEFMYATSTPTNTSGTINLKFSKKMAEFEVDCDVELSGVFFQNATNGVVRGRAFDFSSDKFTTIEYSYEWNAPIFRKEANVITKEKFIPHYHNGKYRLILPAQDAFACQLNFTIEGNQYSIALEQNITELKENHLYIIHINKAGECTIKINDWQDDGSGVIVDKDETN